MFLLHFITLNILSTLMISSSNNWFSMWMMIEINTFSMIMIMKKFNESMIKYFLINSFSSSLMLMMMITSNSLSIMNNSTMMILPIMIKLSIPPFHLWMLSITELLKWIPFSMIITTQKIPNMIMISYLINNSINLFIFMSIVISSINNLNQTSIQKILILSSIYNSNWILIILSNKMIWQMTMISYFTLILMISHNMSMNKSMFLSQLNMNHNKINIIMMTMMIISIPPTILFLPKWMLLNQLLINSNIMMILMLTMTNMLNTFIYMKILFPMMSQSSNNKWKYKISNPKMKMIYISSMTLTTLMI